MRTGPPLEPHSAPSYPVRSLNTNATSHHYHFSHFTACMVTMTIPHLFFQASLETESGRWGKRSIFSPLHAHIGELGVETFLWCWCKETGTLKVSHPPQEMAQPCDKKGSQGLHPPPTQSHDAIKHDHIQGWSIQTAFMCLIYSLQGFNYSGSGPPPHTKMCLH